MTEKIKKFERPYTIFTVQGSSGSSESKRDDNKSEEKIKTTGIIYQNYFFFFLEKGKPYCHFPTDTGYKKVYLGADNLGNEKQSIISVLGNLKNLLTNEKDLLPTLEPFKNLTQEEKNKILNEINIIKPLVDDLYKSLTTTIVAKSAVAPSATNEVSAVKI